MLSPEYYVGREQTYLKHFFIEKYIERVAYNIGSSSHDFVYVDGFSGPWRSNDEKFEDTSFVIAIKKLRDVRTSLDNIGRKLKIRCLFVEKERDSFNDLENAVSDVSDIETRCLHGEFEDLISDVVRFVGTSFSLVFIDPTGWKGFSLGTITPVLKLRGETLINFMYDDINRHLDDPRSEIESTLTPAFGGPGWHEEIMRLIDDGVTREEAIITVYGERIRMAGNFPYVTSTRILKPTSDRSYFYLVYGTRNVKGLEEFRYVEKRFIDQQEQVRTVAKRRRRVERTQQAELFGSEGDKLGPGTFEAERSRRLDLGQQTLKALLSQVSRIKYEDLLGKILIFPLVWKSDVDGWLVDLRKEKKIEILGLVGQQRIPRKGCLIVPEYPQS